MATTKRFRLAGASLALMALATPLAFTGGCDGTNPLAGLCCTDYQPGTNMLDIDWGIDDAATNARFAVSIQAIGDFAGAATAMITDLGGYCHNMAVELGESPDAVT